ncbi:MAG: hypothetical protein RL385_717 [Pseudomonadota bacterium]|jgi:hypothetical protein
MKSMMIGMGVLLVAASAQAAPDLSVDISGPAQAYVGGASQTYSVYVVNVGNQAMNSVSIRVLLPAGLELTTYTAGCVRRENPARLDCPYVYHRPGLSRTIRFTVAPQSQPGPLAFTAQVFGNLPETTTANNVDQMTTQEVAPPALAVPIVGPVSMTAQLCWDAAQSIASCTPYGLEEDYPEFLANGELTPFDPSVTTYWQQNAGQNELHLQTYDVPNGQLLGEFDLVAISSSCFEGTVYYPDVNPHRYNTKFCF